MHPEDTEAPVSGGIGNPSKLSPRFGLWLAAEPCEQRLRRSEPGNRRECERGVPARQRGAKMPGGAAYASTASAVVAEEGAPEALFIDSERGLLLVGADSGAHIGSIYCLK